MKKVKILGIQFDVCTKDEALARVSDVLSARGDEPGKQIVTPNPEMLVCAVKNAEFKDALNGAWMSIPDGIGILWAAVFQKMAQRNGVFLRYLKAFFSLMSLAVRPSFCRKVFPERVTGVDFMESMCSASRARKIPIFLLGAQNGVAGKVKNVLETKYTGLNIAGVFAGSPDENDFPAIQAMIAETRPVFLFVAYGSPKQELWIEKHLKQLPSVKIAMGVGGAFDFIAGVRKRAPKWMKKLGLEWLYRLLQEPSRFKRIWNACVRFPLKVISRSAR